MIRRKEEWGELMYNSNTHEFIVNEKEPRNSIPYITNKPVVLNLDLTFKCNMCCTYCVAKDLENLINKDLLITDKMIKWINNSPFLVIVITGGEPFLPEKEDEILKLIKNIHKDKGIIIDTNGTIIQ